MLNSLNYMILQSGSLGGKLDKITTGMDSFKKAAETLGVAFLALLGVVCIVFGGFKFAQAVMSSQQRGKNIGIAIFAVAVGAVLFGTGAFAFLQGLGDAASEPFKMILLGLL